MTQKPSTHNNPSIAKSFISPAEWFGGLPNDIQNLFLERMVSKSLKDGALLHARGDEPDGLYHIVSGQIKVSSVSSMGKELVLILLEPGSWFGEIALFDDSARTHDVYAVGDTELNILPRHDFHQILNERPQVYHSFCQLLCQRLRLTFDYIEETAFLNLGGRLAKRLLYLAQTFGAPTHEGVVIQLRLSQEELAKMLVASRQRINKELKEWERQGWVQLTYNQIKIFDPQALERLIVAQE